MDFLFEMASHGLLLSYFVVPNWGFAIVLFTTVLRVGLFPLQIVASKQQAKLAQIKPELESIQIKYKDDARSIMKQRSLILKRANVRPWTLVIASFIQIPIFISVFKAFSTNLAFQNVSFGWLPSLAAHDPVFILPLLMAGSIWFQMKSSGSPSKAMAYAMPFVSFIFMASMPAAIALYSLAGSLLQIAGQRVIASYF